MIALWIVEDVKPRGRPNMTWKEVVDRFKKSTVRLGMRGL